MKLKRVGFFRDLHYGDPSEKMVSESISFERSNDLDKEVNYLSSGRTLMASPGFSRDIFSPERIIGPLAMLTDGVYVWPSDLAYYVERHNAGLPKYFLEHIRAQNWTVPDVEVETLEM